MSETAATRRPDRRRRSRRGYAFEGPALELGGLMLDATHAVRHPDPDPARRCSTGTAWSPAPPAPARPRPCSCSPSSSAPHGVPVFAADIKGDLSGLATPGEAGREDHRARRVGRPGLAGDRLPGRVLRARRPGHRHPAAGDDERRSGRCCSARCSASTTPRSPASGWSSTTPTRHGLPLLDLADLRAVVGYLTSDEGKAELKALGGLSSGDRRRDPARADRLPGPGRRRVLRRAGVRVGRPAPARRRTAAA